MSQGSFQVPVGGSESATTFAGQVNVMALALASKNSGSSAPANGPNNAPVQFQDWMDTTSALFPIWKLFDGVNWPKTGRMDVANSIWCPQRGGGLSSVASASTTDIGSQPGGLVTITGAATINSFGTNAVNGEEKRIYCGGAFTLANSASIVCPGGSNINVTIGDIFTAIYDGAGVWLIYGYQRTSASAGTNLPTGATFWMYQTGTLAGTTRANGNTIGNTGSGANETGASYQTLFNLIWNQSNAVSDPEILFFDSTGAATTRGASALADWTALKRLTVWDMRGRAAIGVDTMGSTAGASGRVTSTTMSPDGNTLGAVGGSQTVTLTTATMPAHAHAGSSGSQAAHSHLPGNGFLFYTSGPNPVLQTGGGGGLATPGTTNTQQPAVTVTIATEGSSGAHLNMIPAKGGTWYIAL